LGGERKRRGLEKGCSIKFLSAATGDGRGEEKGRRDRKESKSQKKGKEG